jgi:hypothetical protein
VLTASVKEKAPSASRVEVTPLTVTSTLPFRPLTTPETSKEETGGVGGVTVTGGVELSPPPHAARVSAELARKNDRTVYFIFVCRDLNLNVTI